MCTNACMFVCVCVSGECMAHTSVVCMHLYIWYLSSAYMCYSVCVMCLWSVFNTCVYVYVHACVCMACMCLWVRGKGRRQTYRSNHFTDQDDRGLSGCTGWQDPAAVQFKQKLRTGVNINPSTVFSAECETWIFSPYTDERFTSRRTPNISNDWEEISNCLLKKKKPV